MSYENLMNDAYTIQQEAIKETLAEYIARQDDSINLHLLEQAIRDIEAEFADIPDLFSPFTSIPDPESYTPLIDALNNALAKLSPGYLTDSPFSSAPIRANHELDLMSGAASYLEDWTGRAAMTFKTTYIDPFPSYVENLFIVTAILKSALEAHRALWESVRTDIRNIAKSTLAALDALNDCDTNDWTVTLNVTASILSLISIPLALGGVTAPAAIAFEFVAAALNTTGTILEYYNNEEEAERPEQTELRYSGETARVIINGMRDAIAQLHNYIQEKEDEISRAMLRNLGVLINNRDSFIAARPALADATPENITSPEFMGYSH